MVQLVRPIGRCNVVKVVCSIQMRELIDWLGLDWLHMAYPTQLVAVALWLQWLLKSLYTMELINTNSQIYVERFRKLSFCHILEMEFPNSMFSLKHSKPCAAVSLHTSLSPSPCNGMERRNWRHKRYRKVTTIYQKQQ